MKYKVGDLVIPRRFDHSDSISFVDGMLPYVGIPNQIKLVNESSKTYTLKGDPIAWSWPEEALDLLASCNQKPAYDLGEFTKAAMQGLLFNPKIVTGDRNTISISGLAGSAVNYAKATIKALEEEQSKS